MQKKIDITSLIKAQKIFERFRIDMLTDRDKAGAIQAFEFCYEFAWKMMKRVLAVRGVTEIASPKSVFRKAVLEGIIADVEVWFIFQEKRNLLVHTYNIESVEEIVKIFDLFSTELKSLVVKLEENV